MTTYVADKALRLAGMDPDSWLLLTDRDLHDYNDDGRYHDSSSTA